MYVHVIILLCDSILCVYNPITEQYIFRQTCMYMSSYYHVTVITVYMFLDRHVCTCHHIIM